MRFPPLTPLVKTVLFVLTGCFIAQLVLMVWMGQEWVQWLMFYPEPGVHTLWQVATYPLIQPGVLGYLMGMVFFWWVVAPFETTFGRENTIRVLATTQVAAVIPVVLFGLLFGDGADRAVMAVGPLLAAPLVSVHTHIIGVIAAYAWAIRFRGNMSFFGVLQLSAKQLILLLFALSALFFLENKNIAALLADVGAIAGGIGFTEWLSKGGVSKKKKKKRPNPAGLHVVKDDDDPPRWLN